MSVSGGYPYTVCGLVIRGFTWDIPKGLYMRYTYLSSYSYSYVGPCLQKVLREMIGTQAEL